MYWRDETSGRLLTAVMNYWTPYADSPDRVEELNQSDISALRMYLSHWANAPCWSNNPHATAEHKANLETAISLAESISSRADVSRTIDALSRVAIDPF